MEQRVRHTPASAAEVQAIIAEAVAKKRTLEVCGGGSKRLMRMPVTSAALLDMSALTGITDYDPDELVMTARAGTTLVEIEAALEERRQMLAFEPFDHGPLFGAEPGQATLGGIVAANVSGSRRLSFGAARDHILGFTALSGRGDMLKGGGAVVKNVTGFDLPKLMAGSWGTLAVLVSITMRVLPRPRTETTLLFKGLADEAANGLMSAAMAMPAAVSAAAHLPLPRPVTALRLEGFGPSVEVRSRDLIRTLLPICEAHAIVADESAAFWRSVRTLDTLPRAGHVLWRISVPPAGGWRVRSLLAARDLQPDAQHEVQYVYDWAGGLVWAAVPENAPHAGGAGIPGIARSLGGHATLIRAPLAVRETLVDDAGMGQGLRGVHERLKAAFDPYGILNPGLDLAAGF
jgi:glycolate oxidase FAD binding subunit